MPSNARFKGRPRDEEVLRQFEFKKEPGRVTDVAYCKHCSWHRSKNTTFLSKHLDDCNNYQAYLQKQAGPLNSGKVMKQTKIETCERKLSSSEKHNIKRKLAGAVYRDNLPFSAMLELRGQCVIQAIQSSSTVIVL